MVFAFLAVKNVIGVVWFAILYGFFSGSGLHLRLNSPDHDTDIGGAVLSLLSPNMASFARSLPEMG
jgi:ABC-type uncharacterized transport system permease subunit